MAVSFIVVVPTKGEWEQALKSWAIQKKTDLSDNDVTRLLSADFAKFSRIDRDYPPLPAGRARQAGHGVQIERLTFRDFEIATSETFAVRVVADKIDKYADLGPIPHESEGNLIFADPQVAPSTGFGDAAVKDRAAVQARLNGNSLKAQNLNGDKVAIAIMDGGINRVDLDSRCEFVGFDAASSWTPDGGNPPGTYAIDHGTMCAFDALLAAPRATLLDYPILFHLPGAQGPGGVTKSLLSGAYPGYLNLLWVWVNNLVQGGAYTALVASNSWGIDDERDDLPADDPGRYVDNPLHPFNMLISAVAFFGIDIVFAAGNRGVTPTPSIMGANALGDVLTVAGCDVNDRIVDYSSRGPGIDGMFKQKPDITAYTHFDGSGALRPGGLPDKGTSAACAVAAGCVAALRSRAPARGRPTPAQLIDIIRKTARPVGPPPWNEEAGFGILDPVAAARALGL